MEHLGTKKSNFPNLVCSAVTNAFRYYCSPQAPRCVVQRDLASQPCVARCWATLIFFLFGWIIHLDRLKIMRMELDISLSWGKRSKLLCASTTLPSLNKPEPWKKMSSFQPFLILAPFHPFAAPLHCLSKRIRQLRGTPGPCCREARQKAPGREQRAQVAAQSWDWQSLSHEETPQVRRWSSKCTKMLGLLDLLEYSGDSRKTKAGLKYRNHTKNMYWWWNFLTPHYRKSAHTVYENWRVPVG